MRELLASHKDLAARVGKLEAAQKKHGSIIGILAEEIDEMERLPEPPKRRIGFKTKRGFFEWNDESIAKERARYERALRKCLEIFREEGIL